MCFVIAKKVDDIGCVALQTDYGQELVNLKTSLIEKVGNKDIELVTISRPSAYGEYAPYRFVDTKEEFEREVLKMKS